MTETETTTEVVEDETVPTSYTTESTEEAAVGRGTSATAPGAGTGRRKEARGLLPQQGPPAGGQRALQAARPPGPLRRHRPHPRRRRLRPGRCSSSGRRSRAQPDRRGEQPPGAEEGRLPDARRARHRAQEGRPQEGPQGLAVLQALIGAAPCAARPAASPTALDLTVGGRRRAVRDFRAGGAEGAGREAGRIRACCAPQPPIARAWVRAARGRRILRHALTSRPAP